MNSGVIHNMFFVNTKRRANLAGLFDVVLLLLVSSAIAPSTQAANIQVNPSDFAVYAGGNVQIRDRVDIQGGIAQGALRSGNFQFGHDGQVHGNVYLNSPNGSLSGRSHIAGDIVNAHTGGAFNVEHDASVGGNIDSPGRIRVRDRGRVDGSITARNIELGHDSSVGGDVYYQSGLTMRDRAQVFGSIAQGGNPDTLTFQTRNSPNFTSGQVNLGWLEGDRVHAIDAGSYKHLKIRDRATIELTAGTYNFDRLNQTGHDTEFLIDTTLGDVILNFADGGSIGDRVKFTKVGTNDFLFQSGGRVSFGHDARIDGSVYVFGSGDLVFGDRTFLSGQAYTEGNFFLGHDAQVFGQGFNTGGISTSIPSPVAVGSGLFLIFGTLLQRRRRSTVGS